MNGVCPGVDREEMRIVIDLQSCQLQTRHHGIGRSSLSLARAMVREGSCHEFWFGLDGSFPDTLPKVCLEFDGLIPRERIRVFNIPGPVEECTPANLWRTRVAESPSEDFMSDCRVF